MDDILERLTKKRERLRELLQTKQQNFQEQLDEWVKVELTYSSNHIEGNTLTRRETAEVIERGFSAVISGKSLKDQVEALNHARAVDLIRQLAAHLKGHQYISERDIKSIHKIILSGIDDDNAGNYRRSEVFIRGVSDIVFPQPDHVPMDMRQLVTWLQGQQGMHPVLTAADLHYRFVAIHPFVDGNGRTGRLLMNLVLLLNGYPLAIIRAEDRQEYLDAIHTLQAKQDGNVYYSLICKAVERSLDAYLNLVQGKQALTPFGEVGGMPTGQRLLKIGQVALEANVSIPTVRYYVSTGLIKPSARSQGNFLLFDKSVIEIIKEIRRLQKEERLSLVEIHQRLMQ